MTEPVLPELPKPHWVWLKGEEPPNLRRLLKGLPAYPVDGFHSVDQMRAWGQQCYEAGREAERASRKRDEIASFQERLAGLPTAADQAKGLGLGGSQDWLTRKG